MATSEFAERGLSGARIDEITAATRTSKRMIYYHFGSKEGLYLACSRYANPPISRRRVVAAGSRPKFSARLFAGTPSTLTSIDFDDWPDVDDSCRGVIAHLQPELA